MHLIPLLCLLQLLQLAAAYDYCHHKTNVCDRNGLRHFICQMEKEMKPPHNMAKLVGTIPDTLPIREKILSYFNKFRNEAAGGTLTTSMNKTFKPAKRMRELIWDNELAYTARTHAATRVFKHSACHSVFRFPYVGETVHMVLPTNKRSTLTHMLDKSLKDIFDQYLLCEDPDEVINKFQIPKHHGVGGFTIIVNDRISRVGCGLVAATGCTKEKKKDYCYFITCHYEFNNLLDSYIYKIGSPASRCERWKSIPSETYPNLCKNTGEIFPLDLE